ncbi:MAG: inositol monophosphatase [Anaerolineae bacterium]|nr:inositol monophosphatase [Anaerolineae bacterium]
MLPTLNDLKTMAYEAGKIQRAAYEQPILIKHKGDVDLVTEVDFRCESLVIQNIQSRFSGHSIVAEESGLTSGDQQHTWYIDPLDGTINYAHGVPFFSISIAYAYQGHLQLGVVYDPMRDECFSAEAGKGAWVNDRPMRVSTKNQLKESLLVTGFSTVIHHQPGNSISDNFTNFERLMMLTQGVRRLGSAALDLAYVAAGRLDAYWDLGVKAWDVAAGALMVEEAGGKVTTVEGDVDYMKPPYALLAAAPDLHQTIMDVINQPKA